MAQKQTPMMAQYFSIKEKHPDELLFFRLGDFYEMFYDDALIASRELEITLTGRTAGQEDKAPMCGVPFHAADTYIERLVKKGYKVAICEQLEDPKQVKGLVKRDVVRVITPGTVLSEHGTEAKENNFLGLCVAMDKEWVLLFCDISTGQVIWDRVAAGDGEYHAMANALTVYAPAELVLVNDTTIPAEVQQFMTQQMSGVTLSPITVSDAETEMMYQEALTQFSGICLLEEDVLTALGYLLYYFREVIKIDSHHINSIEQRNTGDRMILDASVLRHLEITKNTRDGGSKGTLLRVLDRTLTPMGARLLKQWVESPLMDIVSIERRQMAIGELLANPTLLQQVRTQLDHIFDFERILGRLEVGTISTRDFVALRESLAVLPAIQEALSNLQSNFMQSVTQQMDTHEDVHQLLCASLADSPALTLKDGNVFREGYSEELDELRSLATNSQEWLQRIENNVREATGMRLKTGYNKVFGYYFEVTHAQRDLVPETFIRKQTLTNAERYITPELKEFEIKMLSAKERIIALENQLFHELKLQVRAHTRAIQQTARALAQFDAIASLAMLAYEQRYICPHMSNNGAIVIKDGRHPVIESYLTQEVFVPNDVSLNHDTDEFILITGPNMAGKSTYMRQVAILMIMAQIGSYIPAREATISPVDRIFTRVGASDDIASGQSTFMVEMKEVSYILEHATSRSLIILDEIGRGTSTFDGLSIAQAVVEHICERIHAKTLFATHYHELIGMAEMYPKLKNYTVAVKDKGKDVLFLRRIIPGGADRSYGIHVARLAGLPASVVKRAEKILVQLETENPESRSVAMEQETQSAPSNKPAVAEGSASYGDNLFTDHVWDRLLALDIMSMTPIEALNTLYQLQEEVRRGGGR